MEKSLKVKENTWAKIIQYKFENRHVFGSVDEVLSYVFKNIKKVVIPLDKEKKNNGKKK